MRAPRFIRTQVPFLIPSCRCPIAEFDRLANRVLVFEVVRVVRSLSCARRSISDSHDG
jgi:hypothetical protein